MSSSENNTSKLLTLPAELRNQIYEEVVYSTKIVVHRGKVIEPHHALAAVCRQTRAEYRPVYNNHIENIAKHFELRTEDFEHLKLPELITSPQSVVPERTFTFVVHLTKTYADQPQELARRAREWCLARTRDRTLYRAEVKVTVTITMDWQRWTERTVQGFWTGLWPISRRGMGSYGQSGRRRFLLHRQKVLNALRDALEARQIEDAALSEV